jgi:hypothetical protein
MRNNGINWFKIIRFMFLLNRQETTVVMHQVAALQEFTLIIIMEFGLHLLEPFHLPMVNMIV